MPGLLSIVSTPIGNLEDITLRALRVLREATLIAAEDTRRTAKLLNYYGIATRMTSFHEHNQHRKEPALLAKLESGAHVALVSDAGTPAISDPGARLIRAAMDRGVRIQAIPGPSAVLAALVTSGFPADTFVFLGFPPARSNDRLGWLAAILLEPRAVIFFEAPHRIRRTLEDCLKVLGDRTVMVARELTKSHEELVRGPISLVLSRLLPKGEFTVVLEGGPELGIPALAPPSPGQLAAEFGLLTESGEVSRRGAVSRLAKKYGMPSRQIYRLLEDAKSSGV